MKTLRAILVGCCILFGFSVAAVAQEKSTLCHFENGPRAGETQDYAPRDPIPVGSPCYDGQGSTGHVVPPKQ